MVASFGDKMAALAVRLLNRFGTAATWTHYVDRDTDDPQTHAVFMAAPKIAQLSDAELNEDTLTDAVIAAKGLAFTPTIGDEVRYLGTDLMVRSVQVLNANGVVAAYRLKVAG